MSSSPSSASTAALAPAQIFDQLAELAVHVGANVQPGQIVAVSGDVGKEAMTRAIAQAAYRAGAKFVDVQFYDPYVKHARIEHAAEDTLDYVPPWYGARMLALGEERAARITLSGPAAPGLMDDLDQARAGKDRLPWLQEVLTLIGDRSTNWTIVPCPQQEWAKLVYPDLEPHAAYERLTEELRHVCRLDEPDALEAWRSRTQQLEEAAGRLSERRFDALHYEGPGTDLTIGLLPTARWATARFETAAGIKHIANVPTEEVFTSPDPQRCEGTVRSTRPLVLYDGTTIRGLEVRFEGGRAVQVDAEQGADVIRGHIAADDGAARLGEVALVDRESRIGQTGTVFYDTLLDENATSHIAFGNGFDFVLDEEDWPRRNASAIHIDFMIGGDDVDVTGITGDGERVPVLREGAWQL